MSHLTPTWSLTFKAGVLLLGNRTGDVSHSLLCRRSTSPSQDVKAATDNMEFENYLVCIIRGVKSKKKSKSFSVQGSIFSKPPVRLLPSRLLAKQKVPAEKSPRGYRVSQLLAPTAVAAQRRALQSLP